MEAEAVGRREQRYCEVGFQKRITTRMFDWNDLKYFLAVARSGSTLSAAKSLRVNQSTVHRRIQELEKQLSCELVRRHPTGYRLTEMGEHVLAHATRVEGAATDFERAVSAKSNETSGTIKVTCPEALGPRLIGARLIEKFNSRYPDVRVEFVMSDRIIELGTGEADIAIRAKRPVEGALFGRKIAGLAVGGLCEPLLRGATWKHRPAGANRPALDRHVLRSIERSSCGAVDKIGSAERACRRASEQRRGAASVGKVRSGHGSDARHRRRQ